MSSEPKSGAPKQPAHADFGADAELVLTALSRMVATIRGEQTVLDRLRAALDEAADAIARAKSALPNDEAAAPALDVAALLDELEHRIDAMLDIADGEPQVTQAMAAPAEAPGISEAEPVQSAVEALHAESAPEPSNNERVPTVSGVVLQLGLVQDADTVPDAAAIDGAQGEAVTTVSMLEAMVEALSATVPETAAAAQPAAADTAPGEPQETVSELAEPMTFFGDPIVPERELLANFAELEAVAIPPPEVGAAVIFTTDAEAEPAPELAHEPETAPEADTAAAVEAESSQPWFDAEATEPEATAATMAAVSAAWSEQATPVGEPAAVVPPDEAAASEQEFAPAQSSTDVEAVAEPLQQPEQEPEQEVAFYSPAAPEPSPIEEHEPAEPPPEQALPDTAAAAPPEPVPQPEPKVPEPKAPETKPPDPLAPLKAMSANETIALFG
jgi:hypothetical protein